MKKVFIFPGQGSQKVGMGAEQFDKYPEMVKEANDVLGYNVSELCKSDPNGQLNNTAFTQPALFTVSALMFKERVDNDGDGDRPQSVAGHSLGEYNALYAAGAFDFSTGLKLVQKRGEIMSKAKGGGMAAVIGLEDDKVAELLNSSEEGKRIDIANYNSPGQIVVSGKKEDIEAVAEQFKAAGAKRYLPLAVSGAFHSRYMSDAGAEFSEFISQFTFNPLGMPVIANINGKAYENDKIVDNLIAQMSGSVRWVETIKNFLNQDPDTEFIEVGPGAVLTGLVKRIKQG